MKKLYVLVPIIGCLIFGVMFWRFNANYADQEAAKKTAAAKLRADKQMEEQLSRKKAVEDAIQLQEKRKVEKAAREKREAEEKQAQIDLKDQSDRARDDSDRLQRTVDRLENEVKAEQQALAKLAKDRETLTAEAAFQQKYVGAAEANRKSLEEVLTKIENADKQAALAAAQQAKNKK